MGYYINVLLSKVGRPGTKPEKTISRQVLGDR